MINQLMPLYKKICPLVTEFNSGQDRQQTPHTDEVVVHKVACTGPHTHTHFVYVFSEPPKQKIIRVP